MGKARNLPTNIGLGWKGLERLGKASKTKKKKFYSVDARNRRFASAADDVDRNRREVGLRACLHVRPQLSDFASLSVLKVKIK